MKALRTWIIKNKKTKRKRLLFMTSFKKFYKRKTH